MIHSLLLLAAALAPQEDQRVPVEASPQTLVGELVFTAYDVSDLFEELAPDWDELEAAELEAELDGEAEPDLGLAVLPKKLRTKLVKGFTQSLRDYLDPPFVPGENRVRFVGMSLRKLPTSFIFTGTKQQQAWVEAFLEAHRGLDQFLTIDTSFLAGPRGAFRGSNNESGNRFFEDEKGIAEFWAGIRKVEGTELVSAPRILTTPGRRASLSVLNQMAYVESVTMRIVEPGGVEIADPEIATLEEGITMDIKAVPVPKRAARNVAGEWVVEPGLTFALHIAVENVTVERPIPTRTVRVNSNRDGEGIQVMMPQVTRISLEAEVRLVPGAGILIGGPSTEEERDVAILIHLPK